METREAPSAGTSELAKPMTQAVRMQASATEGTKDSMGGSIPP